MRALANLRRHKVSDLFEYALQLSGRCSTVKCASRVAHELPGLIEHDQAGNGQELARPGGESTPREHSTVGVLGDPLREVRMVGGERSPNRRRVCLIDSIEEFEAGGGVALILQLSFIWNAQAAGGLEHSIGGDETRESGEEVGLQDGLAPASVDALIGC